MDDTQATPTPALTNSAPAVAVPFPGPALVIGGRSIVPAPLPLGVLRRAAKDGTMKALTGIAGGEGSSVDVLDALNALVLASWKRNHPEMTAEDVDDLVDLRNAPEVVRTMMEASGLTKVDAGAGAEGTSGNA